MPRTSQPRRKTAAKPLEISPEQLEKEKQPIPADVWHREHHARIWREGKCGRCHIQPRSAVCKRCQTPLCSTCSVEHRKEKCLKAAA